VRILFIFKSIEWLGIEYLSAALEKAGHQTDLAFEIGLEGTFYFHSKNKTHIPIIEKIEAFKPDIVLFSSTTNLFPWVREVADTIKKHYQVPIIVGGIHATIQPERVIADKNIDMICVGEGEEAIVELVNKLSRGENYYDTKNIWCKNGNTIVKNKVRPLIANIDQLPFPNKDIFYQYGCFTDRLYVMTSRGCPYTCTYCFNHQLQALYKETGCTYVRRRSVDSVIKELKFYKEKYKMKSVHFYDDTFILNRKWVTEFAGKYTQEISLPFYCLVRANLVTNEIIKALKGAGCVSVGMGIESGNDYMRNHILKRNMSTQQICEAAKIIKENKIKLVTFNIFGIPGEKPQEMLDTMRINLQIKPDSLFTYTFYPFPGTDLMNSSLKSNYIDRESYEKLMDGFGDYQSRSLLNLPNNTIAYNMKVILALLNKLPRSFHNYFLNVWVLKNHSDWLLSFIKVLSIPFYSSWEAKARFKEQISMFTKYYARKITRVLNRDTGKRN
jgi:anaerobic magnesium-protoporphyrin IX monomethyl ester cyclase